MVCLWLKWLEINLNSGWVKLLVKWFIVNVSGSVVMLNIIVWLMLKFLVNIVICEVIISLEVDIIVIMVNISQNSGWCSIFWEVNDLLFCIIV